MMDVDMPFCTRRLWRRNWRQKCAESGNERISRWSMILYLCGIKGVYTWRLQKYLQENAEGLIKS